MKLAVLATRRPSSVGEQRVVGALRAETGEARRDLRVEHVRHLGLEAPAHQRDVLAPGVHDDLDGGVGEHFRERRSVEVLGERVDDHDPLVLSRALGDRELDQAEQRAVAALAHELGVERETARARAPFGERLADARSAVGRAHGATPGSRYSSPILLQPRFQRDVGRRAHGPTVTGAEQAGLGARGRPAAERVEERVADLALGGEPLQLGDRW